VCHDPQYRTKQRRGLWTARKRVVTDFAP
jgi:hypothetical protein